MAGAAPRSRMLAGRAQTGRRAFDQRAGDLALDRRCGIVVFGRRIERRDDFFLNRAQRIAAQSPECGWRRSGRAPGQAVTAVARAAPARRRKCARDRGWRRAARDYRPARPARAMAPRRRRASHRNPAAVRVPSIRRSFCAARAAGAIPSEWRKAVGAALRVALERPAHGPQRGGLDAAAPLRIETEAREGIDCDDARPVAFLAQAPEQARRMADQNVACLQRG